MAHLGSFEPLAARGSGGTLCALLVMVLVTLAAPSAALAGDERDHELARRAVRAGEVLPLSTLLERLQQTHPGQVLELELEREEGRWIYEVKLLRSDGRLQKLELDAANGRLLQIKDRGRGNRETPREAPR